MKLLRVTAQGLPLFKEKLDLSFYAQQRVAEEDKMNLYSLFSENFLFANLPFERGKILFSKGFSGAYLRDEDEGLAKARPFKVWDLSC